jgi:hypothetical protein
MVCVKKPFMKKLFFLVSILLLAIPSFSQFQHGLKGGVNFSTVKNATDWDPGWGASFHFGWFGQVRASEKFSFVTELLVSDKGFGATGKRTHFLYLAIPVSVRYAIAEKISIEAGAGIGYLASTFASDNYIDHYAKRVWNNPIDFQLSGGFHFTLNSALALGLRYEHGLSNVVGPDSEPPFSGVPVDDPLLGPGNKTYRDFGMDDKNRNIQVSLYYTFVKNEK